VALVSEARKVLERHRKQLQELIDLGEADSLVALNLDVRQALEEIDAASELLEIFEEAKTIAKKTSRDTDPRMVAALKKASKSLEVLVKAATKHVQ